MKSNRQYINSRQSRVYQFNYNFYLTCVVYETKQPFLIQKLFSSPGYAIIINKGLKIKSKMADKMFCCQVM